MLRKAIIIAALLAPDVAFAQLARAGKDPITAACTGAAQGTAWFRPVTGRRFNIDVSGTFVATVAVERSFDDGATARAVTVNGTAITRTAAASESLSEDENGVLYRLRCTAWTSGTVNLRISQ